jgi:hypothetical protein
MSNDFNYSSLAELLEMDITALEDCWEDVPTDDQTYLNNVLARELRKLGTVDDVGELRMIQRFIRQYQESGYVPAGNVWLRVPDHLREQFKSDDAVEDDDDNQISRRHNRSQRDNEGLPPWLAWILLGLAFLAIPIAFYFFFLRGDGYDESKIIIVDLPTMIATITSTPTPQPTITPTATPIALDNVDRSIGRGDRQDRTYFPVLLQISSANYSQPDRAFVVQEHEISIAEWHFDSNPDIASWVGGLLVRPVLGIPYSEQNDALFQSLTDGSSFVITMNTGDILRYNYASTQTVGRTDTGIFRQTHPGLVLLLIGQEDDDGHPTNERLVIEADYDLSQELDRINQISKPSVTIGQAAYPLEGVTVQVEQSSLRPDENLTTGMVYALVDVQITTSDYDLAPSNLTFVLEDDSHTRFLPTLDIVGECGLWQQTIPANTSQCVGMAFVVSQFTTRTYLQAAETVYTLDFAPPEAAPNINSLEVLLRRVNYGEEALAVDLYIYNPLSQDVEIRRDDLWLALGYTPNPSGPHQPPLFTNQDLIHTIPANAAWEVVFQFPYDGQTHGTLGIMGHVYAVDITGD